MPQTRVVHACQHRTYQFSTSIQTSRIENGHPFNHNTGILLSSFLRSVIQPIVVSLPKHFPSIPNPKHTPERMTSSRPCATRGWCIPCRLRLRASLTRGISAARRRRSRSIHAVPSKRKKKKEKEKQQQTIQTVRDRQMAATRDSFRPWRRVPEPRHVSGRENELLSPHYYSPHSTRDGILHPALSFSLSKTLARGRIGRRER